MKRKTAEAIMPRTTLCLLPLVVGAALLVPAAHAQGIDDTLPCSDQTIAGDYAFRISGVMFPPPLNAPPAAPPPPTITTYRDGIAMTHFDGNGNLTQQDYVVSDGQFAPLDLNPNGNGFNTQETGTYHVFADCTGNATIGFPTGVVAEQQFVIGENGRTIHMFVSKLQVPGATAGTFVTIPTNRHSDAERVR